MNSIRSVLTVAAAVSLVVSAACGGGGGGDDEPCEAGTYLPAEGDACEPWTVCTGDQYESTAPTATSDRVCAALTACSASEYESTPPTATSDRVCAALTGCDPDEYESTPPTPSTDRVCSALTVCTASEYESTPPTPMTDRVCSALTACTASEYESTPPTATSDRACSALTVCTASEYESAPPTATSDRACTALTVCTASQYESAPPTSTSDRVCTALTVCTASEYESTPPTPTSDRLCTALTVCAPNEYESVPPTPTSDRICTPYPGTDPSVPGEDCSQLLAVGMTDSGSYWIDPDADGDITDAFETYCDMTTDGGGWTLLVWTDTASSTPLGLPYPGLAPCAGLGCSRGSSAGGAQIEPLVQRSTEFGLGQSDAAGESIIELGAYQYAGKYIYGSLAAMDLVYGPVTCGASSWTGVFRTLAGPTTYNNATVYLANSLSYSSYDYASDTNSYIWNVGAPNSPCDGSGNMPGSWSGTWYTSQYGPYNLSSGRRAIFVRAGTAPDPLGSTAGNPGDSCLHILTEGASTGDGLYWIDPTGSGTAFQVRCDMTTDGGGWTITFDVDAAHFDGRYVNNHTVSNPPPTATNQYSDVWNAETFMPFAETLWACGQQDNAATYYWRYNNTQPHTWMATTTDDYYVPTLASNASNAAAANCGGVSKADAQGYGWVVLETGAGCGTCQNMLYGMYHYSSPTVWDGCNATSTTYGAHASPYDGRSIQYPICNLQQTSNGRFWMGVR